MPHSGLASVRAYLLRGAHPTEEGQTLLEAVTRLVDFWTMVRTLAVHDIGNLVVTLHIGNQSWTVEFTSPSLLDEMRVDPAVIPREVIRLLGVGDAMGKEILTYARATVTIDAIRPPGNPTAWVSEAPPEVLLPKDAPEMIRVLQDQRRPGSGRPRPAKKGRRSDDERRQLEAMVQEARRQNIPLSRLAREVHIPVSTLRDARARVEKRTAEAKKPPRATNKRPPTPAKIRATLEATGNNAAEAARRLGLAPRTVRDARARLAAPIPKGPRSPDLKGRLLGEVALGSTPTEAARRLGVPERTAREWAQKAKIRPPQKG